MPNWSPRTVRALANLAKRSCGWALVGVASPSNASWRDLSNFLRFWLAFGEAGCSRPPKVVSLVRACRWRDD